MLDNYNKARRYLYKLDPKIYKDVLHDAFLSYFSRTGLNLFERSNTNVIGVVKNQYFETLRKSMYKKDGIRYAYHFVEYEEQPDYNNPLEILIAEETLQNIKSRFKGYKQPDLIEEIFNLKFLGYSNQEISVKLGVNVKNVQRHLSNLKKDRVGYPERFSAEEREEMKLLRNRGESLNQIAIKFQTTIRTVWLITTNKTYVQKPIQRRSDQNIN